MFKNQLKFTMLFLTIALVLFSTCCFATTTNVTTEENTDITSAIPEGTTITPTSDELSAAIPESTSTTPDTANLTTISGDLYKSGTEFTVSEIVDGNAYLFGTNITITGEIYGNLFICAETVNLEQCYIYNSAYITAETLNFNAACTDLYVAAKNCNCSYNSYIVRDAKIAASSVTFKGVTGRNLNLIANSINLGEGEEAALIYGNLKYSSEKEIEIASGIVTGETTFTQTKQNAASFDVKTIIMNWLSFIIISIIIFLIAKIITPKFNKKAPEYVSINLLKALGIAILGIIILSILTVLSFLTQYTVLIGLLLLTIFIVLLILGIFVFILTITAFLAKGSKFEKNIFINLLLLIVVASVTFLATIIPYAGTFIGALFVLLGFGITIMNFLENTFKKENSDAVEKEEKITIEENTKKDEVSTIEEKNEEPKKEKKKKSSKDEDIEK